MTSVVERVRSGLVAPVFDDPERTRIARLLYPIALSILAVMLGSALVVAHPAVVAEPRIAWSAQAMVGGLMLVVLGLVRLGRVRLAAGAFSSAFWLLITGMTWAMGGINSPTIAAYVLVAVLAGFLWGTRGVTAMVALTAAAGLLMLWGESAGLRPPPISEVNTAYAWLVLVTSLVVTAQLVHRALQDTDLALGQVRTRAREQAAVAELGQRALAGVPPSLLLPEACRVIGRTLCVEWVSILERTVGEDESLLLRAGDGWPEEAYGVARFDMSLATQAGYTLLTRQPVVVDDQEQEDRFPASRGLRGLGVVSSLSVVVPGDEDGLPYGEIGVHSTRKRHFSADDVVFVEAVANLVALALRRARDQQALKSREEELRQAQKMEAVGRFAGGIAHDFNNLLTAITGYNEFLLRSLALDHPGRADAQEIARVTEQASALTHQILAFSRRQVLQPQVIDLNEVIRGTDSLLRRLIGEDLAFTTRLAPDLVPVRVDPGQVEQVLVNLAVNARDAMPRGGELRISTWSEELPPGSGSLVAVVEVSDTGVGMDPETQVRAFDPFFTTKDRFKGTGLGLSTVYGIVEQSGGSISVESQLGRGARFRVQLPRAPDVPAQQRLASGIAPAAGSETLLLTEDEASVRRFMRRVLDEQGYTVLEAANGAEALKVAARHPGPIDLLVTDVIMPELGGAELTQRLKRTHPETRVLYVSGYADDALGQHGVLAEGASFLAKPFTSESLVRKVREVLDLAGRREAGVPDPGER